MTAAYAAPRGLCPKRTKMLELYTYYRSVSAHRVRIALNHKAIPYQSMYTDW